MTLADLLDAREAAFAAGLRVCLPATVESYDPLLQTIDAMPSIGLDEQTIIVVVPVVFPSGGDGALTFPLRRGDWVTLVFCDRSMNEWWVGSPDTPGSRATHTRYNCFALPGGRPPDGRLDRVDAARTVLGATDDTGPRIAIAADAIHMGVGHEEVGNKDFATAQDVVRLLNALKTVISSWEVVPGDGGAALKTKLTALFLAWPGPAYGVAAQSLKCL